MAKVFQVDTGSTLTTGLRAYYKLEDVNDYYTTGPYNLTNNNVATFAAGKYLNGVNLVAASSQFLSTTSNLGIDGGAFSWAGWIKIASQPGADNQLYIFEQASNNTSNVNFFINYQDSGGTKRLEFERLRGGVADDRFWYNVTLTIGTWYHIAITYDGTTVRGYVNNSDVGNVASSGNGSADRGIGLWVGCNRTPSLYWNGMIDEVGVWSKALSTTEIADLYNNGAGQTMVDNATTTSTSSSTSTTSTSTSTTSTSTSTTSTVTTTSTSSSTSTTTSTSTTSTSSSTSTTTTTSTSSSTSTTTSTSTTSTSSSTSTSTTTSTSTSTTTTTSTSSSTSITTSTSSSTSTTTTWIYPFMVDAGEASQQAEMNFRVDPEEDKSFKVDSGV